MCDPHESLMNHMKKEEISMNIGFIGGGNMAAALIGGLQTSKPGAVRAVVIEPSEAARASLVERFGALTHAAPHADLATCDAIVLAVKPQQFKEAAQSIAPHVAGRLIVSVAAGIRCADITRWTGGQGAVVRCMPNTPALIGAGITGLFAGADVSATQRALAETLLGAVGETVWVAEEALLDAVTAVSGSGPAYVFYFIEALERSGLELGLDADAARRLAISTMLGAARLAAQSDDPPAVLRERVTSKGGTTYAALTSMEQDGVGAAIQRAVRAASARAAEMGDEFGKA